MDDGHGGGDWLGEREKPWSELAPAHRLSDLVLPERELELLRTISALSHPGKGAASDEVEDFRGFDDVEQSSRVPGRLRPVGRARHPRRRHRDPGHAFKPGFTLLFAGPSGTGKTMAAQILGAELRMPIFEVDVSNAMSDAQLAKRLIERTFAEARRSDAIVLFERAGPLLARHPPGGHFVSQLTTQLTHLLSLSREYAGIVIFVSRVSAWIDPAVARCFDFVVEFPFPDRAARDEIWRRLLTSEARLSDADRKYLATQFGLPGRAIHSGCVAAAEEARKEGLPVELRHVVRALEREQSWVPSDQPRGSDGSLVFRRRWEPPAPDAEADQPPQPAVRRMTRGARHPRIKPTSGE